MNVSNNRLNKFKRINKYFFFYNFWGNILQILKKKEITLAT